MAHSDTYPLHSTSDALYNDDVKQIPIIAGLLFVVVLATTLLVGSGFLPSPFLQAALPYDEEKIFGQDVTTDYVPGEILIKFKKEVRVSGRGPTGAPTTFTHAGRPLNLSALAPGVSLSIKETVFKRIPKRPLLKKEVCFDIEEEVKLTPTSTLVSKPETITKQICYTVAELEAMTSEELPLEAVSYLKKIKRQKISAAAADKLGLDRWVVLNISNKQIDPQTLSVQLSQHPAIEYVEPNYIYQISAIPNDPLFSQLWGIQKIEADVVWDTTQGEGVVVAVSDTGVDYNHEDLAANIWTNSGEIPNNGIDDDGNGFIDDVRGWDFTLCERIDFGRCINPKPEDNDPADIHGHGTHVSGTIAAVGNNNKGVIGVAPRAKIMAIKGLSDSGGGYTEWLAKAIRYAADNGADVINNSWGGGGQSQLIEDAFNYAYELGAVSVASAGNSNSDASGFFPANHERTITVAATTQSDQRASFSNYGLTVDVAAPGVGILSTIPNNNYGNKSGTSMAAPHVAGVAALVIAGNPDFTNNEVRDILRSAVDPVNSTLYIGTGRINARKALQIPPLPIAELEPISGTIAGIISIRGTAAQNNFKFYTLSYGVGDNPQKWTNFHTSNTPVEKGVLLANFDTNILPEGNVILRLVVNDTRGRNSQDLILVKVKNIDISFPINNDVLRLGSVLDIKGTTAGIFKHYIIEYGSGPNPSSWSDAGIILENGGVQPVVGGLLALWDTSRIPQDGFYTLRLTILRNDGTRKVASSKMIYFSSLLKKGWPQYAPVKTLLPIGGGWFVPAPSSFTIQVADLDNDGKKEVIIIRPNRPKPAEIIVFNHDGSIRWKREIGTEVIPRGFRGRLADIPVVGDIDGDGKKEIIVSNGVECYTWGSDCTVYGFNHDGSDLQGWPLTLPYGIRSKLIADIDNDGQKEIVAIKIRYIKGIKDKGVADKTYKDIVRINHLGNISLIKSGTNLCFRSSFDRDAALSVGNIDNDPELEIITTSKCSQGVIAYNHDGITVNGWPNDTVVSRKGFIVGDVDGDGEEEIVFIGRQIDVFNQYLLYVFNGNGEIEQNSVIFNKFMADLSYPALGDVDGDGNLEISFYASSHEKRNKFADLTCKQYLLDYRGGSFAGWPRSLDCEKTSRHNDLGDLMNTVMGDVSGDGKVDILLTAGGIEDVAVATGNLARTGGIWAWNADGTTISFDGISPLLLKEATSNLARNVEIPLTINDLDGDGKVDIIAGSTSDIRRPVPQRDFNGFLESLKDRGTILVWNTNTTFNSATMQWPALQHDSQRTNRYVPPKPGHPSLKNRPPRFQRIPKQTVEAGKTLDLKIIATDPDGDPLTFGIENKPATASFTKANSTTYKFSWTPTEAGKTSVIFTVTDNKLPLMKMKVKIEITQPEAPLPFFDNFNRTAPTPNNLGSSWVNKNGSFGIVKDKAVRLSGGPALVIVADFLVGDVDISAIVWVEDSTSAGLVARYQGSTIDGSGNQNFYLALIGKRPGSNSAELFLYKRTDSKWVRLASSPQIKATSGTLNFKVIGNRLKASFGGTTITYTDTDNSFATGGVGMLTFQSKITFDDFRAEEPGVNQPPEFKQTPNQTVEAGNKLTFTVSAIDPDNDPLTYSATSLPKGAFFNASTRTFSWIATNLHGIHTASFSVTDGQLSDTLDVQIKVLEPNQPPEFKQTPNQTVEAGSNLTFTVLAIDPDNDPLTYSATSLPQGSAFNATTQTFFWTATNLQIGIHTASFSVTDGQLSDTLDVQIKVTKAS